MLKVGLIGIGIISKGHIAAFSRLDGIELTAVADIDTAKLEEFQKEHNAAVFTDYKKMIDNADIDIVVIALPHGLHKDSAVYAAQKGKHIFLEKPMANTVAECDEIIAATQENNVKIMIGHIQRYMEENIKVKELINSGKYGKLVSISEIRNQPYFVERRPKWFTDKKLAGGGILMNFGVHSLDRMTWITDSEIKKINGNHAQYIDGIEVDGNAQILVEFENGVSGVVSLCGYNVPIAGETTFYLTDGAVKIIKGKGVFASNGGDYEAVEFETSERGRFVNMWKDFILHIETGAPMPLGGEYGREIMKNIEKIYS